MLAMHIHGHLHWCIVSITSRRPCCTSLFLLWCIQSPSPSIEISSSPTNVPSSSSVYCLSPTHSLSASQSPSSPRFLPRVCKGLAGLEVFFSILVVHSGCVQHDLREARAAYFPSLYISYICTVLARSFWPTCVTSDNAYVCESYCILYIQEVYSWFYIHSMHACCKCLSHHSVPNISYESCQSLLVQK